MRIAGPERYKLCFDAEKFAVTCSKSTPKFSGIATRRLPKLYVVSLDRKLIYVGITRQPMRARLQGGFTAHGANGYANLLKGDEKGEAQVFCDRLFQAFGHKGYKQAGARGMSMLRNTPEKRCPGKSSEPFLLPSSKLNEPQTTADIRP
jgi:hypothetical protein